MFRYYRVLKRVYLNLLYRISPEKYKDKYPVFLRQLGINIAPNYRDEGHGFIHPSVYFDGNDFTLITIGNGTTISANVVLLTHDYSITKGLNLLGRNRSAKFLKAISIGDNSFVGMNSMILPGVKIGNNVVVGAGSVVTKNLPDNVVAAGNPAKIICSTQEWAKKHYNLKDYIED